MTRRDFLVNGSGTVTLLAAISPLAANAGPGEPISPPKPATPPVVPTTIETPYAEFDANLNSPTLERLDRLSVKFRRWQVESLLNQSADLLDRCLRERSERDDLAARLRLLELERQAEENDQQLRQDRIAAEEFDIPQKIHSLEHDSDNTTLGPNNRQQTDQTWEAVIGNYTDAININLPVGAGTGTTQCSMVENTVEKTSFQAQRVIANISKLQASTNVQTKALQLKWDLKEKEFQLRKLKEQKLIREKKNNSMINGQALDFGTRIAGIDERLKADLEDAVDRASIAATGLNDFYAFEDNGGKSKPKTARLDEWLLWVRNATRWILAFGHRDQAFTKIISVRNTIGESKWKQILKKTDSKSVTFEVLVELSHFPLYRFVRIRGLSCFLVGEGAKFDRYTAAVTPPRRGAALQIRAAKEQLQQIDQQDVPVTILGRIESRLSPRSPETTGLISLINVSPIGDLKAPAADASWRIELQPASPRSGSLDKLDDLELELILAGQPAQIAVNSYA